MAAAGCYLVEADITWLSTETEAEKQAIIDKVEQIIDKVTGTHWCAEEFDIKLNGNNKNRLFVPLETDIVSIDLVEISCIELDSSWYTYDKNSILLNPCIGATGLWGKNYVTDGKFFYWKTDDPTHDLFYWTETIAGDSTVNRESADIQAGQYCCRLDIDADWQSVKLEQTLQLIRNRTYRLEFYYKNTITAKTDLDPRPRADSATANTLVDAAVFTKDDEFNGAYIEIVEGTGMDNGLVKIIDTRLATNDIVVASWPGTQPNNTSRYVIYGTLKVKLFNPEATEYLTWKIEDEKIVWYWETGDEFFAQGIDQHLFDPTTTWTLFTAEFTSHEDFVVYDLVFENDGGSSYSIYIDSVGILGAGIAMFPITEDYLFPRGYNNIRITGTHGESGAVPEAIKQAGIALANWEVDPASEAAMGLKKSEKIGDYSYTNLATAEEGVLTGVDKADMYLRHYIKRKAIIMAP